jgi:hypothetical protein
VKEVVFVSRGVVHLKGFSQGIETFVITGIAGGRGGRNAMYVSACCCI